jgi:pyruvate,water dikinase
VGDSLKPIAALSRADRCVYGSKATALGELTRAGFSVPDGVALPMSVFDAVVDGAGLSERVRLYESDAASATPRELIALETTMTGLFEGAALSEPDTVALAAFAEEGTTFAVRSSAANEDLEGATFAGQYVSFLNVPPHLLVSRVLQCFASLFGARAALYRRRKRIEGVGRMGVIVQQMVQASHSGIVFTKAPRHPGKLLLECGLGLCDAIVSGQLAPSRYYIDRSTLEIDTAQETFSLSDSDIRRITQKALVIEALMGHPQDIEYSILNDDLLVLQARPITS